jgi:O-antigen/teichoic acid export membrane protein
MNFWIFAEDIIVFVSSKSFLGTWESIASWWSDQVLPFLGVVLVLSFIKQVYNYLFVALEQQNLLFWVNLTGVLIGAWIWIYLIPHYGLLWGVITQVLIEVMFAIWAMWIERKNEWLPFLIEKWYFNCCL